MKFKKIPPFPNSIIEFIDERISFLGSVIQSNGFDSHPLKEDFRKLYQQLVSSKKRTLLELSNLKYKNVLSVINDCETIIMPYAFKVLIENNKVLMLESGDIHNSESYRKIVDRAQDIDRSIKSMMNDYKKWEKDVRDCGEAANERDLQNV